jgi:anti-sigma B factor antagonist
VPLSIQTRAVGEVTVVALGGRIVEGDESAALDACVSRLLPLQPYIVLNLRDVSFVDSAGLGLLVRLRTRTRAANGDLKLCAAGDHVRHVLEVTKLNTVLPTYLTDVEGIAAFYAAADVAETSVSLVVDILCVYPSADVAAYTCELLRQAGYRVSSTTNLADAWILVQAMRPRLVVIATELHAPLEARLSEKAFLRATRVVGLPDGFSTEDAGAAGQHLLDQVRSVMVSR